MESDPLLDTIVNGRYQVVRMLGEGGMSVVYEVQHAKLKRQFALKRLLPALTGNPEARLRFEREAEMLASLHHPNIVEITDWDVLPDGAPFMILEFLHGAPIRVRIDRGQLPWEAIARIGDQTMSALSLAHRLGITHRDLKPENIFIAIDDAGEERVKLLDFGVSKLRSAGRTTGAHAVLGTPSYMSPEQAQGQTELVGPSTDVWAMGTILYELATRRVAFTGETLAATAGNITGGRPEPIAALRPDAPAAFIELVDRATSLDPSRRIVTIEELRADLRAALEPRLRAQTPIGVVALPRPATGPIASPRMRAESPVLGATSVRLPQPPTATWLEAPRRLGLWLLIAATLGAVLALGLVAFLQ